MRPPFRQLGVVAVLLLACAGRASGEEDLEMLARAVDVSPDDARVYDAYALAAFKAHRYDDAIAKLKMAVARLADYPEGFYKLAYAYRQKREWSEAVDYARRYIAIDPARPATYFGLGAALEGVGDRAGALFAFERFVALEHSPEQRHFIEVAEAELRQLRGARPAVSPRASNEAAPAPTQLSPEAARLGSEAAAERDAGRLARAATLYAQAIDAAGAQRGAVGLLNELGAVQLAQHHYDAASRTFFEATERDPFSARSWYNLAGAQRKADKLRAAVASYRRYIELSPEDPVPYFGLGQTLRLLGDVPGASYAYRTYIEMEKRPGEQRWVDRAKSELDALQATATAPAARN